jgi:hypothetical protein
MAADRPKHPSLADIFGEETVLVNIAKETTNGTIRQRIREWCSRSERHVYIGRPASTVSLKINNCVAQDIFILTEKADSSVTLVTKSSTKSVGNMIVVPTKPISASADLAMGFQLCHPAGSVRRLINAGSFVSFFAASPQSISSGANMDWTTIQTNCRSLFCVYVGEPVLPFNSFGFWSNGAMPQLPVITGNAKSSGTQLLSTSGCLTEFVDFWGGFTRHNMHIYNSGEIEITLQKSTDYKWTPILPTFLWGNPYSHLEQSAAEWKVDTREEAIEKYRAYILSRPDLLERLKELKGKRLGCWCSPQSCHGEILLELLWHVDE